MLNSNSENKKSVASVLMCLISLISALSICCYHSASAAKGGASTKNGKTSSTAGTNLDNITLPDVFMMLREKFPEVPFYSEEDSPSENTSSQNDTQKGPNNEELDDIPDEAPPSIWGSCCNVC